MKFGFRKRVNLKTTYRDRNECLTNCRDIKNETYKIVGFSELISGEVKLGEDTFKLSSQGSFARSVVFNGKVIEKKGIIYMKGEIKPRLDGTFCLYGFRIMAFYTLIQGANDIYINRMLIGNLYNSIFLLMVGFIVYYSIPELVLYASYKRLVNSLNKKVSM